MKLVYKILLLVVLPSAILSVFFVFFVNNLLYTEVEKRFLQSIENTTDDYAKLLDRQLTNVSRIAKYTARQVEKNKDARIESIEELLRESIGNDSLIYGASVFFDTTYTGALSKTMIYASKNENNIDIISFNSSSQQYIDYFNQNMSWWLIPKETLQPIWTSPYYDDGVGKKLMITYAKPLFIENNYVGIISIDILINNIRDLLLLNEKRIEGNYDPDLYILNNSDSVIIYSEKHDIEGNNDIFDPRNPNKYSEDTKLKILNLINNMEKGPAVVKSSDGLSYFVFYASIENCDWFVIDILSVSKAQEAVYITVSKVISLLAIFIFILIALVFSSSSLITKPVSKLSAFSLEVSKGNYDAIHNVKSRDEIGILANNFTTMVQKLKEREESLKRANKQLLELDVAKNEFLNLISHEIRTPLNGIVGSTHFLNEMIQDPEMADFLEMLKESVDRLDSFSKTALEITQMQTVGNKIKKSELEIIPIINETISKYNEKITNKKLTVITSFGGNNSLLGIREYFKRSMVELISNAIKFSSPETDIKVSTYNESNNLCIKVSNKGEVIPTEKINEIMKPFGLGNKHYDKNIGLGLTYIQKFLEIHNGKIEITSTEEKTDVILIFDLTKES